MKAIQVKYLGPTDYKPSRFKAFTDSQSLTRTYDSTYNFDQFGELLALELCSNMGWQTPCQKVNNVPQQYRDYLPGELIVGTLKNGDNVFCFPDSTVS